MCELHRVLKPGGQFGIYDVMLTGEDDLTFPVPWAGSAEGSAVASPRTYKKALDEVGFQVTAERNRRDFALAFFDKLLADTSAAEGPPPLGLHLLMGDTAQLKMMNVIENLKKDRLAPVELIAKT